MNEEKRNCGRATDRGKEAWIETARRRTEIGFEATEREASEPLVAKPQWSRRSGVDPAVVQGRLVPLPGETSPYARKGDAPSEAERGVSRGRSSRGPNPRQRAEHGGK